MRRAIVLIVGILLLLSVSLTLPAAARTRAGAQVASSELTALPNLSVTNHLGGVPTALAIDGDRAYVANGMAVEVLDVADPTNPRRIGSLALTVADLTGPVPLSEPVISELAIVGDLVYVVGGISLLVVDFSDLVAPRIVVHLYEGYYVSKLVVEGDRAYLTMMNDGGNGLIHLAALDIADASRPLELAVYKSPIRIHRLAISDGFAYLSHEFTPEIHVVDFRDTSNPVQVNIVNQSYVTTDFTVRDGYLYFGAGVDLVVMSLANPQSPQPTGSYPNLMNEYIDEIAMDESFLYLIGLDHVGVVDVSIPTEAELKDTLAIRGTVQDVQSGGHYLYLLSTPNPIGGGLQVFSIADLSAPVEVGAYQTLDVAQDVAVDGSLAYVVSPLQDRLFVVNIADPEVWAVAGSVRTDLTLEVGVVSDWQAVVVSEDLALVADLYHGHTKIIDVSDPTNPTVRGKFNFVPSIYRSLALLEGFAYVASGAEGLRVISLANPESPEQVAVLTMPEYALTVTVEGERVYVGTNGEGVVVVDISNPAAPHIVGAYNPDDEYHQLNVAVSGGYGYISDWDELEIVDFTNPENVELVGSVVLPPSWRRITNLAVANGYVYVIRDNASLEVVDVSDPAHPFAVGIYYPGGVMGIDVVGESIYLASPITGLWELRHVPMIAGQVRDFGAWPVPDVQVTAGPYSTTTSISGTYAISDVVTGTYTITPFKEGFRFEPPTRTVTLPPYPLNADFTIIAAPVSATLEADEETVLRYTDTQGSPTTFVFPAGAVTETTTVVVTPTWASRRVGEAMSGHAFEVEAYKDGVLQPAVAFSAPVSVTIGYSDYDVRVVTDEAALVLHWREADWEDANY